MASFDIAEACKISATYETVVFPELCTFGVHTTTRSPTDWDDLVLAMKAFLDDLETLICPVEGRTISIAHWSTVGFTGWHQDFSFDDSAATYGSSTEMPHQLQTVASYVNDTETTIAVGRRRNRSYLGPVNSGSIDNSDGRLGDALVIDVIAALENLEAALIATPGTFDPAFDGLCVISEAEGKGMKATRAKVGKKYDIHRSRAQKTPESYSTTTLT